MTTRQSLPFEVGQLAEAKSFEPGFRGAWFRYKIREITSRKGQVVHAMEYYDYPGEKLKWTQIYQKPPKSTSNPKKVKQELIVRPQFPQICHENELPDISTISEVMVVVDGVWKVGDLVDWWYTDCFWSGTVTELEGGDKVKITLLEKPLGEGETYCGNLKDLRPSLDWSPDSGWTVPSPPGSQNGRSCARLIHPVKQGSGIKSSTGSAVNEKGNIKATPRSSLELHESTSSHTSTSSLPPLNGLVKSTDSAMQSEDISEKKFQQTHGTHMNQRTGVAANRKSSCSDVSDTFGEAVSAEVPGAATSEERRDVRTSKKTRVDESFPLNSTPCDSIETAIIDLEELVNKVKWLRQTLKFGVPSNTPRPTWKFLGNPAAQTPE